MKLYATNEYLIRKMTRLISGYLPGSSQSSVQLIIWDSVAKQDSPRHLQWWITPCEAPFTHVANVGGHTSADNVSSMWTCWETVGTRSYSRNIVSQHVSCVVRHFQHNCDLSFRILREDRFLKSRNFHYTGSLVFWKREFIEQGPLFVTTVENLYRELR